MPRKKTIGLKIPELVRRVIGGEAVKSIAYDIGMSPSYAYNRLVALGWRAVMVAPDELEQINKTRKLKTNQTK